MDWTIPFGIICWVFVTCMGLAALTLVLLALGIMLGMIANVWSALRRNDEDA